MPVKNWKPEKVSIVDWQTRFLQDSMDCIIVLYSLKLRNQKVKKYFEQFTLLKNWTSLKARFFVQFVQLRFSWTSFLATTDKISKFCRHHLPWLETCAKYLKTVWTNFWWFYALKQFISMRYGMKHKIRINPIFAAQQIYGTNSLKCWTM
jgi:hypothetical protein